MTTGSRGHEPHDHSRSSVESVERLVVESTE